MKICNLTPHAINIYDENGVDIVATIEPRDPEFPARVSEKITDTGEFVPCICKMRDHLFAHEIPVVRKEFGDIFEYLPYPQEDTIFIVSSIVLIALDGSRQDVFAPDTGADSAVRDDSGRIVGVRRLQQ